ncbi:MAG: DUF1697 domain-containing protein [Streptosporangiaceae bacterium]|nr:DUF1697 domain-containing protein [Streptosporangiaceae bacterium]
MATHVALLRGINVGGRNKIGMAGLRMAVSSLGYSDVSTYIQSGNVLFSTPETDTTVLAQEIGEKIASTFVVNAGVVVVTRDQLAAILSQNPYPGEPNPKYVHVVFLGAEPDQALLDRIAAAGETAVAKGARDSVTVRGRVMYLHTPDGYGTSDLSQAVMRITVPVMGTARNLATATRLLALCDGAS